MKNKIKTQSIKQGIAKTNLVMLELTPETLLYFSPLIHENGVRGILTRLKKKETDKWQNFAEIKFNKHKLEPGEKIEILLKTDVLKKLIKEILSREEIISKGIKSGKHEYITIEKKEVIIVDDNNKRSLIEQLLSKGYSDDFWLLLESSEPDLADKLAAGRLLSKRRKTIEDLIKRLENKEQYSETNGQESWQKWIYNHNWLFGANYEKPIEKQRINLHGIMPDYIFPTLDGFVDVLEIKLPSFKVIEEDKSHKGSWIWSRETNSAIGQVVNYLNEMDRLRKEIEDIVNKDKKYNVSFLKPRAFILIGEKDNWEKEEKEGLRKLNNALHGIEVLTYTDLIARGNKFIELKDKL